MPSDQIMQDLISQTGLMLENIRKMEEKKRVIITKDEKDNHVRRPSKRTTLMTEVDH